MKIINIEGREVASYCHKTEDGYLVGSRSRENSNGGLCETNIYYDEESRLFTIKAFSALGEIASFTIKDLQALKIFDEELHDCIQFYTDDLLETRTRDEIEELKRNWRNDPCWDIEYTDGFEAHYDELKSFHEECDAEWDAAAKKRKALEDKKLSEELESLGPLGVFKIIKNLQTRLGDAEERIYMLENPNG